MYQIFFDRGKAAKFVKKAETGLKEKLEKELLDIAKTPFVASELSGRFQGLRSHHFSLQSVAYRIVYVVYPEQERIGILHIGTRENFYKELMRILD